MKIRKIFFSCFLVVTAGFFASCENEPVEGEFGNGDNDPNNPNNPSANFEVEIDGELFVADFVESEETNMGLQIIANSGMEMISMIIAEPTIGTHDLSSSSQNMITYTPGATTELMFQNFSGTINITEIDSEANTISGTFEGILEEFDEGAEDVTFTNGVFENLSFTAPEDNDPSAVFEAELDGELFTSTNTEAVINEDGLQIAGQSDNEVIAIQIFEPEVGTFDLSNENLGLIAYTPDTNSEELAYFLSSGTVTISAIDYENNTVSGTFEGTLSEWLGEAEDIEVTNGVFTDIEFSQEEPIDMATALIDGEEFNANIFITAESGNTISLNFQTDLDDNLVLHIPMDEMDPGEYPVGGLGDPFSASYTNGDEETFSSIADSGVIIITSYTNGILSGTFNFEASPVGSESPVVSVTDGEFSIDLN